MDGISSTNIKRSMIWTTPVSIGIAVMIFMNAIVIVIVIKILCIACLVVASVKSAVKE